MSVLFVVAVVFVAFGAASRLRDPDGRGDHDCELCELEHRR